MTSLYVDIGRLRTAALEIVERRVALRIIENVFDLSLERLAFDCSYGDQPTICGRSRAPGCPGRNDKDTPLRSNLLHSHFTALASTNLSDWVVLPNVLSITNGFLMLQDSGQTNFPARFYRILEQ